MINRELGGICTNKWFQDLAAIQDNIESLRSVRLKRQWSWWPFNFGPGWILGNCIFIAPWVVDVSDDVRRYVLYHECGHAFYRHSVRLVPLYLLLLFGLFLCFLYYPGVVFQYGVTGTFIMSLISGHKAVEKEYQADDFAASIIGREAVLHGLQAIGSMTGTLDNKCRAARIGRMKAQLLELSSYNSHS